MADDEVGWIQEWYRTRCDGAWEHSYGVGIETLDNPGWSVRIDLNGTPLEAVEMETLSRDHGPHNWIHVKVENQQFRGHGDPSRLSEILGAFRTWALQCAVIPTS